MKIVKRYMCEWCIQGHESHGERIYVGRYTDERNCEFCGDKEEVHEVLYED